MGQALRCGFKHGGLGVQLGFLCNIGNAHTLLSVQSAIVSVRQSAQNLEQRRLPGAVAANQSDPFIGFQGKSSVVQQGHMPEGELSV